jgi:hypothetical protein
MTLIMNNSSSQRLARQWLFVALGNTVAGAVVVVMAVIILPRPWSIIVVVLMAYSVFTNWRFARRFRNRARIGSADH